MTNIANRLFDGDHAKSELDDSLHEAGVPVDNIGWDYYDCSLEIYKLPPDFRLTAEAQKAIHAAGFYTCYCNHTDKWETHYHFKPDDVFVESEGWRVSYPHKRNDGNRSILLEADCLNWPREWFKSGYCVIIEKEGEDGTYKADSPA